MGTFVVGNRTAGHRHGAAPQVDATAVTGSRVFSDNTAVYRNGGVCSCVINTATAEEFCITGGRSVSVDGSTIENEASSVEYTSTARPSVPADGCTLAESECGSLSNAHAPAGCAG